MSIKESIDRIRKRVEDLLTDVKDTTDSTRQLLRTARPKPLKSFLERRVESLRPLKLLGERRRKKHEEQ